MSEHEIALIARHVAGLDNAHHAVDATRATLRVLGIRLAQRQPGPQPATHEPAGFPAGLPTGIAEAPPAPDQGATFGVEEFYRRVAYEEGRGCTIDDARAHARAVLAAMKASLTADDFAGLVTMLPNDYRTDLLSSVSENER